MMDYNDKFASEFIALDTAYHLPDKFIKNMANSTDKFRGLILQGAPGVGKTYNMLKIANAYVKHSK